MMAASTYGGLVTINLLARYQQVSWQTSQFNYVHLMAKVMMVNVDHCHFQCPFIDIDGIDQRINETSSKRDGDTTRASTQVQDTLRLRQLLHI